MKTKILAGLLLAGSTMFAAPRIGFGISVGAPAPVVVAPPVVAAVPPCPGPGYVFINGYWQLPAAHFVVHDRFGRFDRRGDHFRR
jgi:WXXGXW repeat (2 copies)